MPLVSPEFAWFGGGVQGVGLGLRLVGFEIKVQGSGL